MRTCVIAVVLSALTTPLAAEVDFARDVQPLLKRHCYDCHSAANRRASYRLDVRTVARRGGDLGEPAIVPGNAAGSPLIRYVEGTGEPVMPPADSGKPRLTAVEVDVLRRWIQTGAEWPDEYSGEPRPGERHWSLKPIMRPLIPPGGGNAIDAFIRQTLADRKLEPSPRADRLTLIRRVTFDLTGLPPTPAEIEAFLADSSTEAWEKVVERLLASPQYGERWGRHWLDVVRYTESQGFEYDRLRNNAWHYRDYVIQAFNDDKPYDQFMREQIAGTSWSRRRERASWPPACSCVPVRPGGEQPGKHHAADDHARRGTRGSGQRGRADVPGADSELCPLPCA